MTESKHLKKTSLVIKLKEVFPPLALYHKPEPKKSEGLNKEHNRRMNLQIHIKQNLLI